MATKTVKVTNGKILNYKMSAPNYKPLESDVLIQGDTTVTRTMLPLIDPNNFYVVGDRLADKASFVGYYITVDPNTNIETRNAIFILDAKYRTFNVWWSGGSFVSPLIDMSDTTAQSTKISSTYLTNLAVSVIPTDNNSAPVYARAAATVQYNGVTYQSQLPTVPALKMIVAKSQLLEKSDPTISSYADKKITASNTFWSSCVRAYNGGQAWVVSYSGSVSNKNFYYGQGALLTVPIFEIPIN